MRKIIYVKGEYYETVLTETFCRILKHAPANSRVVDVGGNIGWFTMMSAAIGHHVDVFEPNKVNLVRQCQSMWLNGWENANEADILNRTTKRGSVNIHPYGVGSNTTVMQLYMGGNPGKATLNRAKITSKAELRHATINIVTLDSLAQYHGWFENRAQISILKVDVEGSEPAVFSGAKNLLKARLVENILMELTFGEAKENAENMACLETIVDAGYMLYKVGGSYGPTTNVKLANGETALQYVLAKYGRKTTVNLWWKKTAIVRNGTTYRD